VAATGRIFIVLSPLDEEVDLNAVAASASWGNFLIVLLIVALVVPVWIFSLRNIFRRKDLSDRSKAWWTAAVVLLPIVGTLVYLLYLNARPPHATPEGGSTIEADRGLTDAGSQPRGSVP
jgi:uncharacterized membrane protein YhaH (DUF805 family)